MTWFHTAGTLGIVVLVVGLIAVVLSAAYLYKHSLRWTAFGGMALVVIAAVGGCLYGRQDTDDLVAVAEDTGGGSASERQLSEIHNAGRAVTYGPLLIGLPFLLISGVLVAVAEKRRQP